jgi:hypothetical protein
MFTRTTTKQTNSTNRVHLQIFEVGAVHAAIQEIVIKLQHA